MSLLYNYPYYSTAATVSSVSGFKSRENCLAAANEWLKQVRETEVRFTARAMCAPQ